MPVAMHAAEITAPKSDSGVSQPNSREDQCEESRSSVTGSAEWPKERATRLEAALLAVPPSMANMCGLFAQHWDAQPSAVLATMLHWAATALGQSHHIRHPEGVSSAPFSLVTVQSVSQRRSWPELIGNPWLTRMRMSMAEHHQRGRASLLADLDACRKQPQVPEAATVDQAVVRRLELALKPMAFVRSPLTSDLSYGLEQSHDGSVLSLNGVYDPVKELLGRASKESMELARLLEMSWAGHEIPLSKGAIPKRVQAHLLWQTDRAQARQLLWGKRSFWRENPPPVCFHELSTQSLKTPDLETSVQKAWMVLLSQLSSECLQPPPSRRWTLSPEATAHVLQWFAQPISGSAQLSLFVREMHFHWVPGFTARMALLLSVLDRLDKPPSSMPPTVSLETARRASSLCQWMMAEHHACLASLSRPPQFSDREESQISTTIDTTDNQSLRAEILRKIEARGQISKRELTRSFDSLPAQRRDLVVRQLLKEGLVVEKGRFLAAGAQRSGTLH